MEHQMIAVFANDFAGDKIDCEYANGDKAHDHRERQKVISTIASIARKYWKLPLQENFISIDSVLLPGENGGNQWPYVTFSGPVEKMIRFIGCYSTGHQAPYTPIELKEIEFQMECLTVNGKNVNVRNVSLDRQEFVLDELVIKLDNDN